jgi:uncharacterized cupin superfamily protein
MWSLWQADRDLYFNSFFVEAEGGNLAIDPLPLSAADATEIEARGGIAWIVVTNRDHERDARALAARTGAKIAASATEAPLLAGPVDRALHDGASIGGATVVALDGCKTPGEVALHFAEREAVVVGDALWGEPAGALRLMPEEKLADAPRAVLSLRRIRALRPQHLLLGDGACIFGGAHRLLGDVLEARTDVYVNRINRDEAIWRQWKTGPQIFRGETFEIGDYIGAEKLGYRLLKLEPGMASCPMHWHAAEEELFVVLAGSATLLTPRGEVALRAGDYVAFPTSPAGAHRIENRGDASCEILLIANTNPDEVCYYPDSHKVLVERSGIMVRDRPVLDYFDGE